MSGIDGSAPPQQGPPYDPGEFWDEMFDSPASVRPHYGPLAQQSRASVLPR